MTGFSLIELVVALVVLSILASVAVGRFVDRQGMQLAAAAGELSALLGQAQRLAWIKNREVCVSVSGNTARLRLNPHPTPGSACSVDLVGGDGQPLAFVSPLPLSATHAEFRFRTDGQPQPAPVSLTLGTPGHDGRTLWVEPVTGLVN